MSELSELTASGNSDVVPGFTLSPFRLSEYGEAEAEFSRRHIAIAAESSASLPPDVQAKIIAQATADVSAGRFCWGMPGFDAQALMASNLSFLLWVCLRIKHPQVKRGEATALLTDQNQAKVQTAVLECMGFSFKKKPEITGSQNPPSPSSGPPSSAPSANETSPGTKSGQ